MKDQQSNSDNDDDEPVRWSKPQPPIEEYLAWDPDLQAWYAPGEPSMYDAEAEFLKTKRIIEEVRAEPPIPPEQLRVPPGTLDVPPAWRKSLGRGEPDLFSRLCDEEDARPEEQEPTPGDPDDEESAHEHP